MLGTLGFVVRRKGRFMDLPIWWMSQPHIEKIAKARALYWESDMAPRDILIKLEIADVRPSELSKVVGTAVIQLPCIGCGVSLDVVVESRADAEAARTGETWRNKRRRAAGPVRCQDCREDLRNRRELERIAEQERQEAEKRALVELRTMPYADYLKTEHWQQVRTAALRRAGYRCALCNAKDTVLDVHHRTYENRGHEHSSDVIVLCRTCHGKFHGVEA